MDVYSLIQAKKQGDALTKEQLEFLVNAYTSGEMPDYQMSAFLMAVCFVGMTDEETAHLTAAMRDSGDTVDLSAFGGMTVDKHSTGGVGDKTTLVVAPLVASLGGKVAKMSGRGLGHTGGTVDKLEAIPGYRSTLSRENFVKQVKDIGVAVIGQSGNLAPADKKMYALRDVTATVDSIPLIVSSIMSKKLAAGTDHIVLDVKYGSGAFMKDPADAQILARGMVDIGKACGKQTAALITAMEEPLGFHIGNALEVREALDTLAGNGPDDLKEVCLSLATELLRLCHGWTVQEARQKAETALADGTALQTFRAWIAAQGGDLEKLPEAPFSHAVLAPTDGYVSRMNSEQIGLAAVTLGAGRRTKEDTIDPTAGIVLCHKLGDRVQKGKPLATLYAADQTRFAGAEQEFLAAITLSEEQPTLPPLVLKAVR